MQPYTEQLEDQTFAISPEDEDYEEQLRETAKLFRPFSEALDSFLKKRGFPGDLSDTPAKLEFLRGHFQRAGIPTPRSIRAWFEKNQRFLRETAFQICFAFGLSVEETQSFFREVCLERGIDCHSVSEAIYWFCLSHGLSYSEAQEMIGQLPRLSAVRLRTDDPETLFTGTIMEQLSGIETKEELVSYLSANLQRFRYNNATATSFIQNLWAEIIGPEGLAFREAQRTVGSGADEDRPITVAGEGDSDWTVYAQILGLDRHQWRSLGADRSIRSVLKDNSLLHPLAEASFPDRDGINKILNGVHVSHERVRKILILLVFYVWWARRLTETQNPLGQARPGDADRCLMALNRYLMDAGYPELYPGNPYDWIFLWALRDDCPLDAFRSYIRELFAVHSEQISGSGASANPDR